MPKRATIIPIAAHSVFVVIGLTLSTLSAKESPAKYGDLLVCHQLAKECAWPWQHVLAAQLPFHSHQGQHAVPAPMPYDHCELRGPAQQQDYPPETEQYTQPVYACVNLTSS